MAPHCALSWVASSRSRLVECSPSSLYASQQLARALALYPAASCRLGDKVGSIPQAGASSAPPSGLVRQHALALSVVPSPRFVQASSQPQVAHARVPAGRRASQPHRAPPQPGRPRGPLTGGQLVALGPACTRQGVGGRTRRPGLAAHCPYRLAPAAPWVQPCAQSRRTLRMPDGYHTQAGLSPGHGSAPLAAGSMPGPPRYGLVHRTR